ncbi:hypothetical protein [Salinicola tamaricis]|uniref:hypothetical protein n=1 Tax=Salinicola tamaricis TaxID=1771309 RepID=UPI001A925D16|nr:hypothetical protein [Salinicola tamaricis]
MSTSALLLIELPGREQRREARLQVGIQGRRIVRRAGMARHRRLTLEHQVSAQLGRLEHIGELLALTLEQRIERTTTRLRGHLGAIATQLAQPVTELGIRLGQRGLLALIELPAGDYGVLERVAWACLALCGAGGCARSAGAAMANGDSAVRVTASANSDLDLACMMTRLLWRTGTRCTLTIAALHAHSVQRA